jgi:hypothetical protein
MNSEHEQMRKAQTKWQVQSKDTGPLSFSPFPTSLYAYLNFEEIQVGLKRAA